MIIKWRRFLVTAQRFSFRSSQSDSYHWRIEGLGVWSAAMVRSQTVSLLTYCMIFVHTLRADIHRYSGRKHPT